MFGEYFRKLQEALRNKHRVRYGNNLREHLRMLDPFLFRDTIMSMQSPANYFGICANMPELRAILDSHVLVDPIRHYALQHFVYVAPRLSETQLKDLLADDQLPWEESHVRRAISEWAIANNVEAYDFLCLHEQVDLLNICWTNEFNVCGRRVVVPGVLPTRETLFIARRVTQMCAWGKRRLVLVYDEKPSEIVVRVGETDYNVLTLHYQQHMKPPRFTCMAVHGDLLYVGTNLAIVFVFNLKTQVLQSQWSNININTEMLMLSIGINQQKEMDLLWVCHKLGGLTVWRHDGTYVGFFRSAHALQAWKNGVAFSVCADERRVRVWDATSGRVQHVRSIDLPAAGAALACGNDMLCVADNAGGIHAIQLGEYTLLWTLNFPNYCGVCLLTRAEQLLYVSTSSNDNTQVLVVVNVDGIVEHELAGGGIVQLVNLKDGVYIRKERGGVTSMLAYDCDPPSPHSPA